MKKKRTSIWLKIKFKNQQKFFIGSYTDLATNNLILALYFLTIFNEKNLFIVVEQKLDLIRVIVKISISKIDG